jgi:hypothetical protein
VFENRALRRIFGPKREEVAGGWRRLHNVKLHNVIRVLNSRSIKLTGRVVHMGVMRNAYSSVVGKPEWQRPLDRTRRRCENIRL